MLADFCIHTYERKEFEVGSTPTFTGIPLGIFLYTVHVCILHFDVHPPMVSCAVLCTGEFPGMLC